MSPYANHHVISIAAFLGFYSSLSLVATLPSAGWAQTVTPTPNPAADEITHPLDKAAPIPPADKLTHPTPPPVPVDPPPYTPPWQPPLVNEPPPTDPTIDPEAPAPINVPSTTAPPKPTQGKPAPKPNSPANVPTVFPWPQLPLIQIDMPPRPQFDYWWLLWLVFAGYIGYRCFLLMQVKIYLQSPPEMSSAQPTVIADKLFTEPYQIHSTIPITTANHSIPHELPLPLSLTDFDFEFSFTSDLSPPVISTSD